MLRIGLVRVLVLRRRRGEVGGREAASLRRRLVVIPAPSPSSAVGAVGRAGARA